MTALVPAGTGGAQLTIERLADELEAASRVDEIKDVRDRAMAIQLYCRRKAGGLAAAQAAGRVVTDSTLRLARLYADEKSAKGRNQHGEDLSDRSETPGKVAIARAAGIPAPNLGRLKKVVDLPREDVRAHMAAIEERGDVVTPHGLMREVHGEAAPVQRGRVAVVIGGRRLSVAQVGALTAAVGLQLATMTEKDGPLHEVRRLLEGRRSR